MTYVLQLANEDNFEFSTQLTKSLHFMMTGYRLKNRPGQWRAGSICVRKESTADTVFEGPDVELVPVLMKELAGQPNRDRGASTLARAAMAHLNLVMIHPFRDGNGRMARCLQSLALARDGWLSPIFVGAEEYLSHNTEKYYAVLTKVGRGAWHPENYAPWLRFMLTAHVRQARTLLRRVKESERLWIELERLISRHGLPERIILALCDAANRLRVRNSTYRAALRKAGDEEITMQTAQRDLAEAVKLGLLVAQGQARGRIYTAGPELTAIRKAITDQRDPRDDRDPFAAA